MSDLAKSKRGGETNLREKVEGSLLAVIISPCAPRWSRYGATRGGTSGGAESLSETKSRGGEYVARRLDHETAVSERRRSQGRKTKADFARRRRNAGVA